MKWWCTVAAHRAWRRRLILLSALTLLVVGAPLAGAHPFAASAFDAATAGREIHVQFKIDATSVVDLLNRTFKDTVPLGKADIEAYGQTLSQYVVNRFLIRNDADACSGRPQGRPHREAQADKVVVAIVYVCARDPDVLTIDSTLFHEEETPHQFLGTVRHGDAMGTYLLSRKVKQARIPLKTLGQGAADSGAAVVPTSSPMNGGFCLFFVQGVIHILEGLDHVLFVIALVSAVASWSQLLKVVTSFTVAHSLTLAAGALQLVSLSPQVVEPIIAASIIYVALENVLRDRPQTRLVVTFGFGLFHGFGFSAVLRELGLAQSRLVPALVGFNLGVEAGQLLIVAPLAPLLWWLRRRPRHYRLLRVGVNAVVALVALYWFAERVRQG